MTNIFSHLSSIGVYFVFSGLPFCLFAIRLFFFSERVPSPHFMISLYNKDMMKLYVTWIVSLSCMFKSSLYYLLIFFKSERSLFFIMVVIFLQHKEVFHFIQLEIVFVIWNTRFIKFKQLCDMQTFCIYFYYHSSISICIIPFWIETSAYNEWIYYFFSVTDVFFSESRLTLKTQSWLIWEILLKI